MNKVIVFLFTFFSLSLYAQDKTDIYKQAFKKQSQAISSLSIPFYFEKKYLGEVNVKIQLNEIIEVDQSQLTELIKPLLNSEANKLLRSLDGKHNSAQYKKIGMKLNFDKNKLICIVEIIPQARSLNSYSLSYYNRPPWAKNSITPNDFSGRLNYQVTQNYYSKRASQQYLAINLEPLLNYHGVIATSHFDYEDDRVHRWTRNSSRLIYIHEKSEQKFVFGDLSYATEGNQNFVATGGLQIAKDYSIAPYKNISVINNYEFILNEKSLVRVFINGNLVRTLSLPKGRNSLKDLPLNQGLNDITLDIETLSGKKETIEFKRSNSFEMLGEGIHQYSYSFGLPSYTENEVLKYRSLDEDYMISFNHNIGITKNFTIKNYLQKNKDNGLLGFNALINRSIGLLKFGPSISDNADRLGFSTKAEYQFLGRKSKVLRNFLFSINYFSPQFSSVDTNATHIAKTSFESSYQQNITKKLFARLGFDYNYLSSADNNWGASLGLSQLFKNSINSTLQFTHKKFTNDSENIVFVGINWVFNEHHQNVYSTYRSEKKEAYTSWQYNGPRKYADINSKLEYKNDESKQSADIFNEYYNPYFNISHSHFHTKADNASRDEFGRFQLESSFIFTDDFFGIAKPVNDSFTTIVLNDSLIGQTININRDREDFTSSTRPFNYAPISDHKSYRYQKISLDASELDMGLKAKQKEYVVRPTLFSGTSIFVGDDVQFSVEGTLVDENGNPFKFVSGKFISRVNGDEILFFTNSVGQFFVEGLKEGAYQISLFQFDKKQALIDINSNKKNGLLNLGKVIFK